MISAPLPLVREARAGAPFYVATRRRVFVVAAAGNYGSSTGPSGVMHTPGNDRFVMTVGALMLSAKPVPQAKPGSVGVGQLNAGKAGDLKGTPPSPNLALNRFLVSSSGSVSIDAASWAAVVAANASWADASWADASWADASWADSATEDAAEGEAASTPPEMSAAAYADLQTDPYLALSTALATP